MIVDVHVHLGWDFTFDEEFPKEELIDKMNDYDVTVQIVQPGTCHDLPTVQAQHNTIAALCKEYPGQFFGMAHPSPHLTGSAYQDDHAGFHIRKKCVLLGLVEPVDFIHENVGPSLSFAEIATRFGHDIFNFLDS